MKQIIRYKNVLIGLVFFSWVCSACSYDYMVYDADQKDGIYMVLQDSFVYKFDAFNLNDSVVTQHGVHLLGMPKDYDRVVQIELIDSATTAVSGIHFRLGPNTIIKAGEVSGIIDFTLYRTRDPELKNRPVCVAFTIRENEYFKIVPGQVSPVFRYIIKAVKIDRPGWWNDDYLGPYSEEVYKSFINEYLSLEQTQPSIFKAINDYCGYWFTNGITSPKMWQRFEYPIVKFIVHPIYDYYVEHPHPDANIPAPKY